MSESKTYRLYIGHLANAQVSEPRMNPTARTFKAKTKAMAEKKAAKFVRDAQLNHMVWELR